MSDKYFADIEFQGMKELGGVFPVCDEFHLVRIMVTCDQMEATCNKK